jgi:UDP-galactopyranose mutase
MNDFALNPKDLICFSDIRWDFLWQRPHHLMSRFAKSYRIYFVEAPVFHADYDQLVIRVTDERITLLAPHLQNESDRPDTNLRQQELLKRFFHDENISLDVFWYYSPTALKFTRLFQPKLIVYDCMEGTHASSGASSVDEKNIERELLEKADILFTAGQSLFEWKKKLHPNTFLFPGSVDKNHFAKARHVTFDPPDQDSIPHPRLGFYGIIDDRFNFELLEHVARLRHAWQFVIIGPVTGIDPHLLPHCPNIHYLGLKHYRELPSYIAGWDIALIPFAHNEITRFISPTKTAEYLAAGKPVISTPIIDIIRSYGNKGLVRIAGTPDEFIRVCDEELQIKDREEWLDHVDAFLSNASWDHTCQEMMQIIQNTPAGKKKTEEKITTTRGEEYV